MRNWLTRTVIALSPLVLGCPADDTEVGGETETGAGTTSSLSATDSATSGPATTSATSGTATGTSDPATTGTATDPSATSSATSTTVADTGLGDTSTTGAMFCGDEPITDLDSGVALLYADLPPIGGTTASTTASTTDGGHADDALWVRLGNTPVTCQDRWGATECELGVTKWWITMTIPPELQMPGEYSFEDVNLYVSNQDGTCQGGTTTGPGPNPTGIVYIDEITATSVVGCIVSDEITELDANGTFTADNCSG